MPLCYWWVFGFFSFSYFFLFLLFHFKALCNEKDHSTKYFQLPSKKCQAFFHLDQQLPIPTLEATKNSVPFTVLSSSLVLSREESIPVLLSLIYCSLTPPLWSIWPCHETTQRTYVPLLVYCGSPALLVAAFQSHFLFKDSSHALFL